MAVRDRLVQKVQTPALPIPKDTPLKQYLDDLNNILRLFFNLLSNAVNAVFGDLGGRFLDMPNGLFFSTVDQPIAVVDVGQVISFNNTYLSNAVAITGASNSRITATYSGVYNLQLSAEMASSSASSKIVYVWITRDGSDVSYTARQYVLAGSSDVKQISYNFIIDLVAGQYIEFKWSSDNLDTALDTQAATVDHPAVPSCFVAVTFASALPVVLPI